MELVKNDLFYSRLPVNEISLSDLLTEDHLFYKVPANWHVVITDVKNSTGAVQAGLHETINLIATASIVAVLRTSPISQSRSVLFWWRRSNIHHTPCTLGYRDAGFAETQGKHKDKF